MLQIEIDTDTTGRERKKYFKKSAPVIVRAGKSQVRRAGC